KNIMTFRMQQNMVSSVVDEVCEIPELLINRQVGSGGRSQLLIAEPRDKESGSQVAVGAPQRIGRELELEAQLARLGLSSARDDFCDLLFADHAHRVGIGLVDGDVLGSPDGLPAFGPLFVEDAVALEILGELER